MTAAAALGEIAREFGPSPARTKLRLLSILARKPPAAPADLVRLVDALCFLRAYPDDRRVLAGVDRVCARIRTLVTRLPGADRRPLCNTGVPGSHNSYPYSFAGVRRLQRLLPGALEIDWSEFAAHANLLHGLGLLLAPAEVYGVDDPGLTLEDWFDRVARPRFATGLAFLLDLLARSGLDDRLQDHLFETWRIPLCFRLDAPGTARCEVVLPGRTRRWQDRPLDRSRPPLAETIARPLGRRELLPARSGGRLIDLALHALSVRNLEILPLLDANPADVSLDATGTGLDVALVGVLPARRSALESLYFLLLLKGGVPIAYGPAGVFLGVAEMGINLFPEFRGSEVARHYAELMRVLHHRLGVCRYQVLAYGMGEDNDEALRSGAFWFYRKLGFRATRPRVEALARREEARMARDREHRSSLATLRRLSHSDVFFELPGHPRRGLDLGAAALRLSRALTRRHGGDRRLATARATERVARALPAAWRPSEREALERIAPWLDRLPGLARLLASERRRLIRFIRAKGGRSEAPAARLGGSDLRLAGLLGQVPAD